MPVSVPALTELELLDSVPKSLLIGGRWREASDGGTFDVHDPTTGKVLATLASATSQDAVAALDAAAAAQESWARTAPRARAEILRRAFDLVTERAQDFALLMTLEMGKPLAEARGEVTYGAEFLRWFSGGDRPGFRPPPHHARGKEQDPRPAQSRRALPADHAVELPAGHGYPQGCPCRCLRLHHGPQTRQTHSTDGAAVRPDHARRGPARRSPQRRRLLLCLRDLRPATQRLPPAEGSFTGSTPVGKRLMADAAQNVLRTSMELGGNAPFIVFEDADLDKAVEGAMAAKMRNMGEACTAANRFLVQESVALEFTAKLAGAMGAMAIGHGTDPTTKVGPLIDAKARDDVHALVRAAVDAGATAITGGWPVDGPGYFYLPTVLAGVPNNAVILGQEIFGPVAPVTTFTTEEEAIRLANASEYGLAAYLYSRDFNRLLRVAEQIEFGMVGFNAGVISNAAAPFGGVKQSGLGREGGTEGIAEYTTTQYTGIADLCAE